MNTFFCLGEKAYSCYDVKNYKLNQVTVEDATS